MASLPDASETADVRPVGSDGPDAGPPLAQDIADQLREENEALSKQCKLLESLAVSMRRLQEAANTGQAQLMADNMHLKCLYEVVRATEEQTDSSVSRSSRSTAYVREGKEYRCESTNDTAEDLERAQRGQFKWEQSESGLQRKEERMENPTHSNNSTTTGVKQESHHCSGSTDDAAADLESVQQELLEFKSEQSESSLQRKEERMESPTDSNNSTTTGVKQEKHHCSGSADDAAADLESVQQELLEFKWEQSESSLQRKEERMESLVPCNNSSIRAEEDMEHRRESTNDAAEDPECASNKKLEFKWEQSGSGFGRKRDFHAEINRESKVLL